MFVPILFCIRNYNLGIDGSGSKTYWGYKITTFKNPMKYFFSPEISKGKRTKKRYDNDITWYTLKNVSCIGRSWPYIRNWQCHNPKCVKYIMAYVVPRTSTIIIFMIFFRSRSKWQLKLGEKSHNISYLYDSCLVDVQSIYNSTWRRCHSKTNSIRLLLPVIWEYDW